MSRACEKDALQYISPHPALQPVSVGGDCKPLLHGDRQPAWGVQKEDLQVRQRLRDTLPQKCVSGRAQRNQLGKERTEKGAAKRKNSAIAIIRPLRRLVTPDRRLKTVWLNM